MITAEEHLANLIANAFHREMEVYGYQVNVDNYTVMLTALPLDEWPAHLADYTAATIDSLPVTLSDEDVQIVADYQYRDRLRALLRSERVEQGKAARVLTALKTQIGPDADAAIAAYKTAQSA
jgi:hypothetical protein